MAQEQVARRTLTEVWANLERAKLSRSDMQPLAQTVFFHSANNDDLLLLEVDSHILEEAKKNGVIIRGDLEDELVLCTGKLTAAVQHITVSICMLIAALHYFEYLEVRSQTIQDLEYLSVEPLKYWLLKLTHCLCFGPQQYIKCYRLCKIYEINVCLFTVALLL